MDVQSFSFRDFVFLPEQRRLTRNGEVVRVGSRALELLGALLSSAGQILSKDQLIAAVWPDTFVDEANLRVHISALRKALADVNADAPCIENIPGRGYSFVAPVLRTRAAQPLETPVAAEGLSNLPFVTVTPVGRDAFVEGLIQQIARSRLVTVIGVGGMGKTTVAVAAARNLLPDYVDGVAFVDFGTITDGDLVTPELVSSLEQVHRSSSPLRDPASFLRNRRMLLLFDNCEHLVGPIAELAAHLLRTCPDIRIIATSREPLRVAAEWVQRLPPLVFPLEGEGTTAASATTFPAVRLFLDRASEALGGFTLDDADAALVGDICRRLDGIALAIELAAGRIDSFGLHGLAAALDDRFRLLRQGRRTAFPRHQTLRATLDWSFTMLSAGEQAVLRRLAVFSGGFSREAARLVAGEPWSDPFDFEDVLHGLSAKSLVSIDVGRDAPRYRLLETTRSYCVEKLQEAEEAAETVRAHGLFYAELFAGSAEQWERQPPGWLDEYGPEIGNLRVALDWAFSPQGSDEVAVALTIAAIPLWFQLSLLEERLAAAARAVGLLNRQPAPDPQQRMKLNVVLGWPQLNAISGVESGPAAWRTVLEIAEELGEVDYQVRALWALWVDRTNSADHPAALTLAERFVRLCAAEAGDSADVLIGHRMLGRSLHMLGQQPLSRERTEYMLERYSVPAEQRHAVRFQYNQRGSANSTLARIMFLQGYDKQALELVSKTVHATLANNEIPSLCHVLSDGACMVAVLAGEWELASGFASLLEERTARGAMDVWNSCAKAYDAAMLLHQGRLNEGIDQLGDALARLDRGGFFLHSAPLRAALAVGLFRNGRIAEALTMMEAELERCRTSGEGWFLAELLRIRTELASAASAIAPEEAEIELRQALALAHEQGAYEWETRLANTLGLALSGRGAMAEAAQVLETISRRAHASHRSAALGRLRDLRDRLAAGGPLGDLAFTTLY